MTRVNLAEAKARLSELVDAALEGEEVIISRRNVPVAKLTGVKQRKNVPQFGMFRGRIWLSRDFDAPLDDFSDYMPSRPSPSPARQRSRRRARR